MRIYIPRPPSGGGFRPIPTTFDWSEMVRIGRNWSEMVGIFKFRGFVLENQTYKKFLSLLLINSRSSNKSALIDLIAFYLHLYRRLEIIGILLHNQNIC